MTKPPKPDDIKPGDAKRGDEVLARMLRTKPQPKWKPPAKKPRAKKKPTP